MKLKIKKPFGEKHRLRRQKLTEERRLRHQKRYEENEKLIEDSKKFLEEARERNRQFSESQAWYQRIQALRLGDPCEFYKRPEWLTGVFVEHVLETEPPWNCWRVRDAQGNRLRARHVRLPGDQEAWPGLNAPRSEESKRRERAMSRMGIARIQDVEEDLDPESLAETGLLAVVEVPRRNLCCGNVGTHGEGGREYCLICGQEVSSP